MDCRQTLELFPEFTLAAAEDAPGRGLAGGVAEHLRECDDCRRVWREWEAICAAAPLAIPEEDSAGFPGPPAGPAATFLARLRARIAAEGMAHRGIGRGNWPRRLLPMAAGLLLGLFLGAAGGRILGPGGGMGAAAAPALASGAVLELAPVAAEEEAAPGEEWMPGEDPLDPGSGPSLDDLSGDELLILKAELAEELS